MLAPRNRGILMAFKLTDDQRMLADSLRGLLARHASRQDQDHGVLWKDLAELGALAATLPMDHDGLGGGGRELEVIAGELGRMRAQTPFIPTVAMFATMVVRGAAGDVKAQLLPAVAAGTMTGSLAWQERGSRHSPGRIETTATASATGWQLSGAKSQVFYGDQADRLLVTANEPGTGALGVFLVDAHASGVERRPLTLVDGQPGADIVFDRVEVQARLDGGEALVRQGLNAAAVAACAECVAGMEELLRLTVDYIGIRVQFGRPIGRNQALQHRCADMLMQLEKARSMTMLAADALSDDDTASRDRTIAQASVIVNHAARFVGEQAIQLHGGIGMTEASDVSRHMRRLFLNRTLFTDAEDALDRLQAMRPDAA